VVRLFSPAGKTLGRYDTPNGPQGPEDISLISDTAGVYRIDVVPLGQTQSSAGRYEIKILELRAATEEELAAKKNRLALRAKGLALLDEVSESLQLIHLPETRVRVSLQAAQLLWSFDETRGRKFLGDAVEAVKEYLTKVDLEDQNYYQSYQIGMHLRQEVGLVLAVRDPETALSFLTATRILTDPNADQGMGRTNQELQLVITVANQMAPRDPKRALQIAEETLKNGYSSSLTETLARLRPLAPDSAAKLAGEIAAQLQGEKLLHNPEAANLAINLLRISGSPARGIQSAGTTTSPPNIALLSEQEYRDLFQKILSEALSYSSPATNNYSVERSSAQNLLSSLRSMSAEVEGFAPGRAAIIAKKANELDNPQQPDPWQKYQETVNKGSLDVALDATSHAPRAMRDQLYQQLSGRIAQTGDFVQARQILLDHIANPFQRQQALKNLEQQEIYSDIAKGKVEEGLQRLGNIHLLRERAMILNGVVNQIGNGQKLATGQQLLEEARSMLGASAQAEDQEQLNALLAIGRAFVRYDSKRGFEIVEPLLDQFNEMSTAATRLDGFGQQFYKDGELLMQNGNALANIANQLISSLGTLGVADFDRAKAGASRIERSEVRLPAFLALAQQAIFQRQATIRR